MALKGNVIGCVVKGDKATVTILAEDKTVDTLSVPGDKAGVYRVGCEMVKGEWTRVTHTKGKRATPEEKIASLNAQIAATKAKLKAVPNASK